MTFHPGQPTKHTEWNTLVGALVEIRQNSKIIRTGTVDSAMSDSSALWIASDANGSRQISQHTKAMDAWVIPQELAGGLHYRMTAKQMSGPGSHT